MDKGCIRSILLVSLLVVTTSSYSQRYMSTESSIRFFSSAPLEDIEATNTKGRGVLDSGNGNYAFSVPINAFVFEKALMQEHFNEKYMESDKYPNATFTGSITDYKKETSGKVLAKGVMTIHGVQNQVELPGTLTVESNGIKIRSVFTIRLEDYKIKVPSLLFQNIAEEVEVTVSFQLKPHEN